MRTCMRERGILYVKLLIGQGVIVGLFVCLSGLCVTSESVHLAAATANAVYMTQPHLGEDSYTVLPSHSC